MFHYSSVSLFGWLTLVTHFQLSQYNVTKCWAASFFKSHPQFFHLPLANHCQLLLRGESVFILPLYRTHAMPMEQFARRLQLRFILNSPPEKCQWMQCAYIQDIQDTLHFNLLLKHIYCWFENSLPESPLLIKGEKLVDRLAFHYLAVWHCWHISQAVGQWRRYVSATAVKKNSVSLFGWVWHCVSLLGRVWHGVSLFGRV